MSPIKSRLPLQLLKASRSARAFANVLLYQLYSPPLHIGNQEDTPPFCGVAVRLVGLWRRLPTWFTRSQCKVARAVSSVGGATGVPQANYTTVQASSPEMNPPVRWRVSVHCLFSPTCCVCVAFLFSHARSLALVLALHHGHLHGKLPPPGGAH